jgi:cytoskeletal protein CcmA (bactofilin family)
MVSIKGLSGDSLNGFMDAGTEFTGELRFRDTFRLDGRLKGKIVSEKTLIIGESAQVEADIDCGVVSIKGTVTGQVQGREKIELLPGSKVYGRLCSPKLVIEEGAFFQGECDMRGAAKGSVVPLPGSGRAASESR